MHALIIKRRTIEGAAAAHAVRAGVQRRAEVAIIAAATFIGGFGFAVAGARIANAHVAVVGQTGAILGNARAHTARAGIEHGAQIAIVAGVAFVDRLGFTVAGRPVANPDRTRAIETGAILRRPSAGPR